MQDALAKGVRSYNRGDQGFLNIFWWQWCTTAGGGGTNATNTGEVEPSCVDKQTFESINWKIT